MSAYDDDLEYDEVIHKIEVLEKKYPKLVAVIREQAEAEGVEIVRLKEAMRWDEEYWDVSFKTAKGEWSIGLNGFEDDSHGYGFEHSCGE